MSTTFASIVSLALVAGGLIAGSLVDSAWYFRLIPLGIGIVVGALLVRRRARREL